MKHLDEQRNKRVVTQSNFLIQASYKLTVPEKRLIVLAASKINPTKWKQTWEITVTANEWSSIFGSNSNAYRDMEKAADLLIEQPHLIIKNEDGEKEKFHWVSSIKYQKGSGQVVLEFPQPLRQYLAFILLQEHGFTSYTLTNIGKLDSFYAIRIYEFLAQVYDEKKGSGWLKISPESLIERLNLPDVYKRIGSLRQKVINPALLQINTKSNFDCTYRVAKKTGRKIDLFEFIVEEKKQKLLDI